MQGLADGYFVLPYTITLLSPDIKMGPILPIHQNLKLQKTEQRSN
jgi:hypothetical protein